MAFRHIGHFWHLNSWGQSPCLPRSYLRWSLLWLKKRRSAFPELYHHGRYTGGERCSSKVFLLLLVLLLLLLNVQAFCLKSGQALHLRYGCGTCCKLCNSAWQSKFGDAQDGSVMLTLTRADNKICQKGFCNTTLLRCGRVKLHWWDHWNHYLLLGMPNKLRTGIGSIAYHKRFSCPQTMLYMRLLWRGLRQYPMALSTSCMRLWKRCRSRAYSSQGPRRASM